MNYAAAFLFYKSKFDSWNNVAFRQQNLQLAMVPYIFHCSNILFQNHPIPIHPWLHMCRMLLCIGKHRLCKSFL